MYTWQFLDLHGDERRKVALLIGIREIVGWESGMCVVCQSDVVFRLDARNPNVLLDLWPNNRRKINVVVIVN